MAEDLVDFMDTPEDARKDKPGQKDQCVGSTEVDEKIRLLVNKNWSEGPVC